MTDRSVSSNGDEEPACPEIRPNNTANVSTSTHIKYVCNYLIPIVELTYISELNKLHSKSGVHHWLIGRL